MYAFDVGSWLPIEIFYGLQNDKIYVSAISLYPQK